MSRPPDVRNDNIVDAVVLAGAGREIERDYVGTELPRLIAAGATQASRLRANLRFSEFDSQPVIAGHLSGEIVLTCQRCMSALAKGLDEAFQVLVVDEERADEPGGYEPIIADPTRLDVRWLVEDQALLALPLVAMHEPGECEEQLSPSEPAEEKAAPAVQTPFKNLRDMMRKR